MMIPISCIYTELGLIFLMDCVREAMSLCIPHRLHGKDLLGGISKRTKHLQSVQLLGERLDLVPGLVGCVKLFSVLFSHFSL